MLLFVPFLSFGQIVVYDKYESVENLDTLDVTTTVSSETLNITEIQDEFIQIQLGRRHHLLSSSEFKNIKLNASWNKKKWNVYDGEKLISMNDEIDVLNYFGKYGFDLLKAGGNSTNGAVTNYFPVTKTSFTFFSKSKLSLTFKNNNNY